MVHETEQETLEALKRWWQQNGSALVAGLVIGLAGVLGWQYWQSHQRGQAEVASAIYETMQTQLAGGNPAEIQSLYTQLKNEYPKTAYAGLGGLVLASRAVTDGELELAQGALQWVVDNASLPELAAVARLRLARVLHARGKAEEALTQLDALEGAFRPEAEEIRGDVLGQRGDLEAAREAYRASLAAYALEGRPNRWVELKLDDLAPPQDAASGEAKP